MIRDLEFVQRPELWPSWPFLVLKKLNMNGTWPIQGTIVQRSGVFDFYLGVALVKDNLTTVPTRSGDTSMLEELIKEGWTVQ